MFSWWFMLLAESQVIRIASPREISYLDYNPYSRGHFQVRTVSFRECIPPRWTFFFLKFKTWKVESCDQTTTSSWWFQIFLEFSTRNPGDMIPNLTGEHIFPFGLELNHFN